MLKGGGVKEEEEEEERGREFEIFDTCPNQYCF